MMSLFKKSIQHNAKIQKENFEQLIHPYFQIKLSYFLPHLRSGFPFKLITYTETERGKGWGILRTLL